MGDKEEALHGREKYWSELDDSEKIDRMREIVKQKERAISSIREQLWDLKSHLHVEGKIVVPIEGRDQPRGYSPRIKPGKEDDVHF